jgi:hypothetical protein
MKTSLRTLAAVVVAGGMFGLATSRAHAQAFGFNYAQPGFGMSMGTGPFGGGAVFGGYPAVVPAPVVAPPVIVPAPVIVPRPVFVARPFYGGVYRPYPAYAYRSFRR